MHAYGVTNEDFGAHRGRRPRARGDEPRRVVLRAADHPRRPPGVALDRRAGAAAARLLPGERRRRRARRDVGRAGARPAPAGRGDRRRGAGRGVRRRDDDELLPRRPHRPARDGRRRRPAVARCPGLTPADISTAFLYDHFTPFVLMQLEELGFCGRGEAKDFATVERLSLGGELPINTSGGLLGEAYIHGMNGITECGAPDPRHGVQPGRRRRARARHRRHRRADERPDPLAGLTIGDGSGEIEAVEVRDLDPRGHEVAHELPGRAASRADVSFRVPAGTGPDRLPDEDRSGNRRPVRPPRPGQRRVRVSSGRSAQRPGTFRREGIGPRRRCGVPVVSMGRAWWQRAACRGSLEKYFVPPTTREKSRRSEDAARRRRSASAPSVRCATRAWSTPCASTSGSASGAG